MVTRDIKYIKDKFPDYFAKVQNNYKANFLLIALDSSFFTFSITLLSQDSVLPYFVNNLTNNSILVGLIPAIFMFGYYFPQIFGAYIASSRSRRKGIILGVAIAERVGIFLIALTVQFQWALPANITLLLFFISYALFTTTTGLIIPAYSDFISKSIYHNRGLFYGIMQGLGGLIGFAASMIATRLLGKLPFPDNFRALFWLGFIFSFISPFLIANFKEVEFPVKARKLSLLAYLKEIPALIRKFPNLMKYIFARHFIGFAMMGNSFYIIYAISHFGLDEGMLGIFTMTILMTQSATAFIWGQIGDHFGYKNVLALSSVFLLVNGLLALLAPGQWAFFIISGLMGGVYSAVYISHPNIIFEIAPPNDTSCFIGISNSLIAPVIAVAPILGGKLIEIYDFRALFAMVIICACAAFVVSVFMFDEPRKDAK